MRWRIGATPRERLRAGVGVLLVAKLVLIGVWLQSTLAGAGTHGETAEPAAQAASAAPAAGRPDGASAARLASAAPAGEAAPRAEKADVRALLDAVAKRNTELDARERELADRKERLEIFEHDVTAKIASLEEIEKRLLARSKEASAAMQAAGDSLAKIYAAMKPSDAAPILDQLDDATVLMIFGRMKEKQVGEILPLMSRDKAIVLTRSLADRR